MTREYGTDGLSEYSVDIYQHLPTSTNIHYVTIQKSEELINAALET